MNYILNIDTSSAQAQIAISANGKVLESATNSVQKEHASFLHPAIKKLLNNCGISASQLAAVAVAIGPGSYTGIRVGLATAKGLCFALNIPLIPLDNLYLLAASCKQNLKYPRLICPMIDARRMEVFTALFNYELDIIHLPKAVVLTNSFLQEEKMPIIFCGSGAEKFLNVSPDAEIDFKTTATDIKIMCNISDERFNSGMFGNIVDTEPFYMKEFYIG